jgi:hypothetical protein
MLSDPGDRLELNLQINQNSPTRWMPFAASCQLIDALSLKLRLEDKSGLTAGFFIIEQKNKNITAEEKL